jgi:N4-(beta-N-acetylglucosaminyl)-L-asparaginase
MTVTRRDFFATAAISAACAATGARVNAQAPSSTHAHGQDHASHNHPKPVPPTIPRLPVLLCKVTGTVGIDAAYDRLKQGGDTLDAALHVTTAQEDDPDDHSNGLGGLPNEEGEVQLDACCLHGPTRRGAAVAAVSGIRNAALLARAVMEHTDYPLLAGLDAQPFALAQGFSKQDLVTEQSRRFWTVWREIRSSSASFGALIYDPQWPEAQRKAHFLSASQRDLDMLVHRFEGVAAQAGIGPQWTWRAAYEALFPAAEPLYVATANDKNEMSSAATTSGLPWRCAGGTGDIAMLGTGCYLDPEVGSAGSSGHGATNVRIAGARTIVENMRKGMSPEEAGMDALRRIVLWYRNDMTALRFVEMVYYILRRDGAYDCVSLWHGDRTGHVRQFTMHDGVRRSEECKFLLEGSPPNGCPGWIPLTA